MKNKIINVATVILSVPFMMVGVFLALNTTPVQAINSNLTDGMNAASTGDTPEDVESVFGTVVNVMFFIIGAVSVIMLIYGGIRYTTSGGNAASITAAKNTIIYSIVGLVVAILAYAIVNFVVTRLQ